MSECHGSFGGTVWLKPATLAAVIKDIAWSLHGQSIHHLLIVNCHGGNFILNPVIDEINQVYPDLQVTMSDEMWPMTSNNIPIFEQPETDLHGGEIETSLMMFLYPQLIQPNKVDYVPPFGREFLDYVTMNQISPAGIWGTPSKGNAEKGASAMAEQVEIITAFALKEFKVKPC
jgi:creatinine amidohydrolase